MPSTDHFHLPLLVTGLVRASGWAFLAWAVWRARPRVRQIDPTSVRALTLLGIGLIATTVTSAFFACANAGISFGQDVFAAASYCSTLTAGATVSGVLLVVIRLIELAILRPWRPWQRWRR